MTVILLVLSWCQISSEPVKLRFKLEKPVITLRQTVLVEWQVEGAVPLRMEWPTDPLDETTSAVWTATRVGSVQVEERPGGRQRLTQTFKLEPFAPGDSQNVQFKPVQVWEAGAAQPKVFTCDAISVSVTKQLKADLELLRLPTDYDDGLTSPSASTPWPWLVAGVGVVLLLGFAWNWYRRRKPVQPAPSADEQLLLSLDSLSKGATFAEKLSLALRRWLASKTGLSAEAFVTGELLERLSSLPEWGEQLPTIQKVLTECDATRFAGLPVDDEQAANWLQLTRSLVSHS